MAYPSYPPPAAPTSRPSSVTISSYLLWVAGAISLIGAVLSLSVVGRMSDAYSDLFEGTAAAGTEVVVVGTLVVTVVINILFAAGLVILSIFNNRGRQGARVTTWVIGGLMLCCSGFGLIGNAATSSMNLDTADTTGGPSQAEVEARLAEALPSWYTPVSNTLTVISLLAILGAVILLALPASHAFFRKPVAAWDPSQPYPYPGADPGYPTAPPPGGPYGAPSGPPPAGPPAAGPPAAGPYGPPAGPPASGPPASGPPASGPPASGPPASGPAGSGPAGSGPAGSGPAGSGPADSGPPPAGPPANDPWDRPPTDPPR